nr:(-)-epi-alpha-bisabolol synthase [Myrothecium sp.]
MTSVATSQTISEKGSPLMPITDPNLLLHQERVDKTNRNMFYAFFSAIKTSLVLFWAFTENDVLTFVVPNATFGILGALASSYLADGPTPSMLDILMRVPLVVAYNWYNVFTVDVSNQRLPQAVQEDEINKPWRPIPMKMITSEQARKVMLIAVPIVLWLNDLQGVLFEGLVIHVLAWLNNDMGGGDDAVSRNAILAVAYTMFNGGSFKIALGDSAVVNTRGQYWTYLISAVISTTIQIQDLKDQEGDRMRDRKTMPLVYGDQACRVSIATFVLLWSGVCVLFWGPLSLSAVMPVVVGALVAWRVMFKRTPKEDCTSWKIWCFWTMTLYFLPVTASVALL